MDAAGAAFLAASLSAFVDLRIHGLFPARFPGRTLRIMPMELAAYLALGLIGGETERFEKLAVCPRAPNLKKMTARPQTINPTMVMIFTSANQNSNSP
jgi:hypothetical protein